MRRSAFLIGGWGIIAGIYVASYVNISIIFAAFMILISGALVASAITSYSVYSDREIKQYTIFFLITVFCVGFSFGVFRYAWFVHHVDDQALVSNIGKTVSLEGVVVEEPAQKESYTELRVRVTNAQGAEIGPTCILVLDDAYSKRQYGDRVSLEGKLTRPTNRPQENGRQFDYVSYLAKDGIFFEMKYANVGLVESGKGVWVKRLVLETKKIFLNALDHSLPYLESKLGSGLVVAGKQALPKDIQNEFVKTGTVQIVVLSGYNVTLIAEAIMFSLSHTSRAVSLSLSGIAIGIFAVAAGGSATILRAVIMIYIVLLARTLRRTYGVGRSLFVTALGMLLYNPMLLVFDASFELSFVATAGLIYGTPVLESRLRFLSERFNIRRLVASTLATQAAVLPLILFLTGTLSVVAVPANLAVSFLVPGAMLLSFITGVVGIFSSWCAAPVAFIAFLLLKSILLVVHFFSRLPGAALTISSFPYVMMATVYGCYASVLWKFYKTQKNNSQHPQF